MSAQPLESDGEVGRRTLRESRDGMEPTQASRWVCVRAYARAHLQRVCADSGDGLGECAEQESLAPRELARWRAPRKAQSGEVHQKVIT